MKRRVMMKKQLITFLIMLSCLASISHIRAMETNCMDSNPEIKKAHESLMSYVQENRIAIATQKWNQFRNIDPVNILSLLKHLINRHSQTLMDIALPAGNIPEEYKDFYEIRLRLLSLLQQLFALIKKTCGITDEQIKEDMHVQGYEY